MPATTTINVSLNVPALPDNDIAFANAAAWQSYWAGANFQCIINQATTGIYGVVLTALTTTYNDPGTTADVVSTFADINAVNHVLVLQSSFDELKTQVAALNAAVKQMRGAMVTAGLISVQ
jgi:hypothetical protein